MESERTEYNESLSGRTNQTEEVSGRRKETFIFACSGLSNTGKLTILAASTLALRRPDIYRAAAASKGIDDVEDAVQKALEFSPLMAARIAVQQKNLMKPECEQIPT